MAGICRINKNTITRPAAMSKMFRFDMRESVPDLDESTLIQKLMKALRRLATFARLNLLMPQKFQGSCHRWIAVKTKGVPFSERLHIRDDASLLPIVIREG